MKILLDLDGTILNSRERLYRLFTHLVPDLGLTIDEYWAYKRHPHSHRWLLENLGISDERAIEQFEADWLERIEMPPYIDLDQPFSYISQALEILSRHGALYLLTARQSSKPVHAQLERHGLTDWFQDVLVSTPWKAKADAVRERGVPIGANDFVVGDTGADIDAAVALGATSVALADGFRSRDYLAAREPDYLYDNLLDFAVKHSRLGGPS